jgi:hypothetical protein
MKTEFKYFLTTLILGFGFLYHQINEKIIGVAHPVLDNYLDDFLCIPLVIYLTGIIEFYLFNKRLKALQIQTVLGIFIFYCLLFEWIVPKYFHLGTADYFDVLMYLSGVFFYLFINHYFIFKNEK